MGFSVSEDPEHWAFKISANSIPKIIATIFLRKLFMFVIKIEFEWLTECTSVKQKKWTYFKINSIKCSIF